MDTYTSCIRCLKGNAMDRNDDTMDMEEHHLPQDVANQVKSIDESRRRFAKSGLVVSGVLLTLASRPSLGWSGGGGGTTGGGKVGRSPSGFCSGNLSSHNKHPGGTGQTCDHWMAYCYSWPSTSCADHFSSHFDCSHDSKCSHNSQNQPYTLLDILCRKHVGWAQNYSYDKYSKGYKYSYYGTRDCDYRGYDGKVYNYNSLRCPDYSVYKNVDSNCDTDTLGQYCVAALLSCRGGYTPYLNEETVKSMFRDCKSKGYFEPTAGVHWTSSQCVDYIKATQQCTSWA